MCSKDMADSKGQCHITCLSPFTTMAAIYKHHFPSSTSLSDDGDDDDVQFHDQDSRAFFITPARWSNKRSIDIIPFKESTHSPMSGLPPEILIHILKHLHSPRDLFNCLRISRTWCECAVELLFNSRMMHFPSLLAVTDWNDLHSSIANTSRVLLFLEFSHASPTLLPSILVVRYAPTTMQSPVLLYRPNDCRGSIWRAVLRYQTMALLRWH